MQLSGVGHQALIEHIQETYHGAQLSPVEVGQPPLAAILSVAIGDHTHCILVTMGLTQLDGDPRPGAQSGWSGEITLRVPVGDDGRPPVWAISLLTELAGKVPRRRLMWEEGEVTDLLAADVPLKTVAFVADPDLREQSTHLGRFGFIRAMGIDPGLRDADGETLIRTLAEADPLLTTDPSKISSVSSRSVSQHPASLFPAPDDESPEIVRVWTEVEALLHRARPGLAQRLPPPATPQELQQAETLMGLQLPDDVRASYMRHDGDRAGRGPATGLFGDDLMSLAEVVVSWKSMCALSHGEPDVHVDGPVRAQMWNRRWVPLSGDSGYFTCIDLDPAPGGAVGQLIYLWREQQRRVIAPSFTGYLNRHVALLQERVLQYSRADGCLTKVVVPHPLG